MKTEIKENLAGIGNKILLVHRSTLTFILPSLLKYCVALGREPRIVLPLCSPAPGFRAQRHPGCCGLAFLPWHHLHGAAILWKTQQHSVLKVQTHSPAVSCGSDGFPHTPVECLPLHCSPASSVSCTGLQVPMRN